MILKTIIVNEVLLLVIKRPVVCMTTGVDSCSVIGDKKIEKEEL